MSQKSILVELDGSAQSRYAAEVAWDIAKKSGMKVTAQHVVDSLATWDFLNFDIAGFIGSAPFFEAHQTILTSLNGIGKSLIEAYNSQAQSQNVQSEAFLDEGTTVREICWRAQDHEFVIIGQRSTGMGSPEEDKRRLPRRSIAETLTYYCPRPLLVIQDRCQPWTKIKIALSSNETPKKLLHSCLEFAKLINAQTEIHFVIVSEEEKNTVELKNAADCTETKGLVKDLKSTIPELSKTDFCTYKTNSLNNYWKQDAEQEKGDTLLVVPVTEIGGLRRTPFGATPDHMVRYLNHAAILFWMEGQVVPDSNKQVLLSKL